MTEEGQEAITSEKHPGRVAQGHQLAALMKKRKEEILCNKEQSTEQSKVHSIVQSTVQSTGQSNDTYIYGVGIPAVLAIGVCVFFTYNKKVEQVIHEQSITPKRRHKIQKNIQ